MRSAPMPAATRYSFTALARRSPRARLYSNVPRSSQWPSIVSFARGFVFSQVTLMSRAAFWSFRIWNLAKSKKTSFSGDAAGTAAGVGAAGAGWTGASTGEAGRVTGVSGTLGAGGAGAGTGGAAPGPTAPGPAWTTSGRLGQPKRAREPARTPTVNRIRMLNC